jgi:hypothetical protein
MSVTQRPSRQYEVIHRASSVSQRHAGVPASPAPASASRSGRLAHPEVREVVPRPALAVSVVDAVCGEIGLERVERRHRRWVGQRHVGLEGVVDRLRLGEGDHGRGARREGALAGPLELVVEGLVHEERELREDAVRAELAEHAHLADPLEPIDGEAHRVVLFVGRPRGDPGLHHLADPPRQVDGEGVCKVHALRPVTLRALELGLPAVAGLRPPCVAAQGQEEVVHVRRRLREHVAHERALVERGRVVAEVARRVHQEDVAVLAGPLALEVPVAPRGGEHEGPGGVLRLGAVGALVERLERREAEAVGHGGAVAARGREAARHVACDAAVASLEAARGARALARPEIERCARLLGARAHGARRDRRLRERGRRGRVALGVDPGVAARDEQRAQGREARRGAKRQPSPCRHDRSSGDHLTPPRGPGRRGARRTAQRHTK